MIVDAATISRDDAVASLSPSSSQHIPYLAEGTLALADGLLGSIARDLCCGGGSDGGIWRTDLVALRSGRGSGSSRSRCRWRSVSGGRGSRCRDRSVGFGARFDGFGGVPALVGFLGLETHVEDFCWVC
jgi:hypothetical protein